MKIKKKAAGKKLNAAKAAKVASNGSPVTGKKAGGIETLNLRLYVAGQTPKSLTAFSNLKNLCEQHLAGRYVIEVVDLAKHPHLAQADQIVALPTLVRKLPAPIKRLIGDLSNAERVVVGMDLDLRK